MANASGAAVSPAVLTPVDTIAPSDPTGLLATSTIASILISWEFDATLPGNRDFKQYVLQRVSSTNTTFPGWTSGSLATFTYENSSVVHPVTAEGGSATSENSVYSRNYWYRVAAKDTAGNQSGWAYVDDLATPGALQAVSAGTVSSVDIGSITADSITTGTLALDGNDGVGISSSYFTVSTNGVVTAGTLNVTNSALGPGIISEKGNDAGDFAVPSSETIQIGHWTPGTAASATITSILTANPSSGYTRYNCSNSFVANSRVNVSGCNPASFDVTDAVITQRTSTYFIVKVKKTGTYISGGTADAVSSAGAFVTDLNISSTGIFTMGRSGMTASDVHTIYGKLNAVNGFQVNGTDFTGGSSAATSTLSLEVFESDGGGVSRGRIRGSDTVAGRIVVENTAGNGNVTLYVDGDVQTINGGVMNVAGRVTAAGLTSSASLVLDVGTVATAANMRISGTANGVVYLTTASSRRHKTGIEELGEEVLQAAKRLKPKTFKSILPNDDPNKQFIGFIAEEVEDAGFHYGIDFRYEDGSPQTLDWNAITVALLTRIIDLERRVAELEG
jgi:hypothetical protein